MALGPNQRDYKTRARSVTRNLARHYARMQELIAQGMDRPTASKQAYAELFSRQPKKESGR